MLKSYLLSSFRKLSKNKGIQFINLLGLIIGITSSLLVYLYIIHETGFDQQHKKKNRIFRVICDYHPQGSESNYRVSYVDEEAYNKLKNDYPEIKKLTNLYRVYGDCIIESNLNSLQEENIIFSDSEVTQIFTLPILKGDQENLLLKDLDLLITETKSKVYFGNKNPIGEIITLKTQKDTILLTVKAVIKDFPENSNFKPDFIAQINDRLKTSELVYPEETYLLLKNNTNLNNLHSKLPEFQYDYGTIMISKYSLQSLNDIYFHSDHINYNPKKQGDIQNIYILSTIAIIILIVSLNNYIIFSIFDTQSILKDIAIRKTLGATVNNIRLQQLISSFIFIFIAFVLALITTYFIIPVWNSYFAVNLYSLFYFNFKFILGSLVILMLVSLISGSYINFYVSRLNPIELFHTSFVSVKHKNHFQRGIVIFQIILFVGLTSFSLIVRNQLNFAIQKNPGYDAKKLLCIDFSEKNLTGFYFLFIEEVKKFPFVQGLTGTDSPIPNSKTRLMHVPKYIHPEQNIILNLIRVDNTFFKIMKIPCQSKNNPSKPFKNKKSLIINECAAKLLGIDNNILLPVTLINPAGETREIEQICKNFDLQGIKNKTIPIGIKLSESAQKYIYLRLNNNYPDNALDLIKSTFLEITGENQYSANFITDQIKEFYSGDFKLLRAIYTGTFLTILIAVIGLINVSLLSLKLKTKEILIRKVAGANEFSINKLLLRNQFRGLILANLMAIPLSIWIITNWLQNFAQHINISLYTFIIPLFLSTFIIVLISLVSVKIIYRKNLLVTINIE